MHGCIRRAAGYTLRLSLEESSAVSEYPCFGWFQGLFYYPKASRMGGGGYSKRVSRIAGVLVIFSVIRYFYLCIVENQNGHVEDFLRRFYTQEIFLPYWFLYEYLGILLILPLLRKMVQNLTEQEARILFALIIGWNILNDISTIYLGTGFVLNLHFYSSISYFILGYLMEDCQTLCESKKSGLCICIGQSLLATTVLYILEAAQLESLTMLLTISVYYLLRYIGKKSICNHGVLQRLILWCGSNVFGIYLVEDYLRNATAFIWEWSAPYISAVPACCIWLLAVFLLGNVLAAVMRRLPVLRKVL